MRLRSENYFNFIRFKWKNLRMKTIFLLLLMLPVTWCTEDQLYEMKTIRPGDDVNLTCARKAVGSLYWIRLVPEKVPEILASSSSLQNVYSHIASSKQPGTFVLHITKAKLSDAAIYICFKTYYQNVLFLKEIHLRIEAPEPDDTVAPVHPRDSVTLQCSVSGSENKTCSEGNSVCCFTPQPHQCFNCTEGTFDRFEEDLDGHSAKECVFSFFKTISSSDAGSQYCAVTTCEETESERNQSEISNEVNTCSLQEEKTVLFVLSAALALSLLVVAFLLYSVKKLQNKSCDCREASVELQTASGHQENQQTDEESLVYSVAAFTHRKSSKAERREAKLSEEESIYTDVRALGSGFSD